MPGIADLLWGLSGAPNPAQQIARQLSGQQPPQQQPPQQQPQDPNAPAPNAQPVNAQPGQPQNNAYPGAPAPPNSPPQPQVLQSTPDLAASNQQLAQPNLMQLYMQLDQRDRAMDGFNRGMALIAANHSSPAMARAIMGSLPQAGDAASTVGNLMSLYQQQQQMGAQQAMLGQADAIDQKNGWAPGTARAEILAGRGPDLIKSMEPTEMAKNYAWAHKTYADAHPDASPAEIDAGAQSILLGAGGGGGGELGPMNIARSHWLADPTNAGKPPPGYMTDLSKWKLYQADLSDARTQFGGLNSSLDKFVGDMSDVANNPNLDKITGSTGGILTGAVEGLAPGEVNDLKTKMTGLQNEAKDMASRGGPKGANQNIKTLGSSPEEFTNSSLTDYRDNVIAPRMKQALTAQANARGAAGMANAADTPGYLQLYMDPMYKSGGELDIGGAPKQVTPDTGPDGKPLKQPNPTTIAAFKNDMEHLGPQRALDNLKAHGFDTSSLR